jgi:hypothetical protein
MDAARVDTISGRMRSTSQDLENCRSLGLGLGLGLADLDEGNLYLGESLLKRGCCFSKPITESPDQARKSVYRELSLGEERGLLGQVDRGELEEAVAVVRYDDLSWSVG